MLRVRSSDAGEIMNEVLSRNHKSGMVLASAPAIDRRESKQPSSDKKRHWGGGGVAEVIHAAAAAYNEVKDQVVGRGRSDR